MAEDELECEKYDNVVRVSQAALNSVKDTIGNPGNLIVIYNPLNVDELKKNYTGTVLVAVGVLRKQKNYISLLKCCNKLKSDFEFKLLIKSIMSREKRLGFCFMKKEFGIPIVCVADYLCICNYLFLVLVSY